MKFTLFIAAAVALTFTPLAAFACGPHPEISHSAFADGAAQPEVVTESLFTVELKPAAPTPEIVFEPSPAEVPQTPQPRTKRSILVVIMGALCFLTGMVNARSLKDANLSVTKALPAAAASNASDSIDLRTAIPGRVEDFEISITVPATPSLVDAKTVTLTLKDSPDNVTFTAVPDVPTIVSTGAGGVGAAAIDRRFKAPIGLNRYIRLDAAVLTAGGDNTAISTTLSLVF